MATPWWENVIEGLVGNRSSNDPRDELYRQYRESGMDDRTARDFAERGAQDPEGGTLVGGLSGLGRAAASDIAPITQGLGSASRTVSNTASRAYQGASNAARRTGQAARRGSNRARDASRRLESRVGTDDLATLSAAGGAGTLAAAAGVGLSRTDFDRGADHPATGGGQADGGGLPFDPISGGLRDRQQRGSESSSGVRAPTQAEENATPGAPGSGGLSGDDRWGNLQGPDADPMGDLQDMYSQLLEEQIGQVESAYDQQIGAYGDLRGTTRQMGQSSQENIGDFFGHAGDVAQAGIPVTQETYEGASSNVEDIYGNLTSNLESMPQRVTDIAADAGGGAMRETVADRTAAASAPFLAAAESGQASTLGNLEQHSAAGQNYLNQLASAVPAEGAQHQSQVEDAMNQQLNAIAFQQAELEGAKQRAISDITADVAGSTSERMANAALSQSLGLDLDPSVDPMDYLSGQSTLNDMMPEQQSGLEALQEQADTVEAMETISPGYQDQAQQQSTLQGLSPGGQQTFDSLRTLSEQNSEVDAGNREIGMAMLQNLEALASQGEDWQESGGPITIGEGDQAQEVDVPGSVLTSGPARQQISNAIRRLYLN